MLNLTNILAAGGVLAIFTMPGAIWALIGLGATCRRLAERNAAQGQTIAGLLARLQRGTPPPPEPDFVPWPRDAGAKLRELVERRHWAHVSPSIMIATTDATLLTAVDPAQQAELDRFHQVRDRFERESG